DEFQWLAQNSANFQGEWVALRGKRLLAHNVDYGKISREVKSLGIDGAMFLFVEAEAGIEDVIRRLLTIRGVHNYTPEDLRRALAFLIENHRLPFDSLVADWLPLAKADEAFHRAKDPAVFRMGIRS